jgi:signal transduction protein with GAF and PtsI domain
VLDRHPIHVADLQAQTEEFPVGSTVARQLGSRTVLGVPLLRQEAAIGVIYIRRTQVQPFTAAQITLLQTFADQAVIAIENVRLFTELREKNQALTQAHAQVTEALEQQTATSEILRVISSSPTDVQPVFDAIVASAVRLVRGLSSAVYRYDGELVHNVAVSDATPEIRDLLRSSTVQSSSAASRISLTSRKHRICLRAPGASLPCAATIASWSCPCFERECRSGQSRSPV